MNLTNKARLDFNKWYDKNYNDYHHLFTTDKKYSYVINSIIIEWFDSVNINIHTDIHTEFYEYKIYIENLVFPDYEENFHHSVTRNYVRDKAIEKANEIYNCQRKEKPKT